MKRSKKVPSLAAARAAFLKQEGPHTAALHAYVNHPEFKAQSAKTEQQRNKAQEQQVAEREAARKKRNEAFPMGVNPLLETDFSQSLHQVACAIDYWSRLEVEGDGEKVLNDDASFGGYLLRSVLVDAMYTLEEQAEFEHKEWHERLEAAKKGVQ